MTHDEDDDWFEWADDDADAVDVVQYAPEQERLFLQGLGGLGAARTKSVCAANSTAFQWLRVNTCVDYSYRRGRNAETRPGALMSSREAVAFIRAALSPQTLGVEMFGAVALNARLEPVAVYEVHRGGISTSIVEPVVVLQPAIALLAPTLVVFHNHPSGNPSPSSDDVAITDKLLRASEAVGVRLLDHYIIGHDTYFSFADHDMMRPLPGSR